MKTKLIIPAYSERMEQAALKAAEVLGDRCIVILNPNSGPRVDNRVREIYKRRAEAITNMGAGVLGYIDLHAGKGFTGTGPRRVRGDSEVYRDIRIWERYMGIVRFFFDDATDFDGVRISPLISTIAGCLPAMEDCFLNPGGPSKLSEFGATVVTLEDSTTIYAKRDNKSAWIMLRRKQIPEFPPTLGAFFATDRSPAYAYQIPPTYWNKLINKFKSK